MGIVARRLRASDTSALPLRIGSVFSSLNGLGPYKSSLFWSVQVSLWLQCVERFKQQLSPTEFGMWIRPLQSQEEKGVFKILAPNLFVLNWVKEHYSQTMQETLANLTDNPHLKLSFKVGSLQEREGASAPQEPPKSIPSQAPAPPATALARKTTPGAQSESFSVYPHKRLNPQLNFQQFVEGDCNRLAIMAARQMLRMDSQPAYNPLVIYGASGLGKTHLLHAIGHEILGSQTSSPTLRVAYLNADRMIQGLMHAFQERQLTQFKKQYHAMDWLLIDDIQFFCKKNRSQLEFRHLFESFVNEGKRLVLACDRSIHELDLESSLASRIESGLKVELLPPSVETAVAILLKKAELNGVDLKEATALWMVEKLGCNIRELEGALIRLNAYAHFEGREVTHPMVQSILKNGRYAPRAPVCEIPPVLIHQKICEHYRLNSEAEFIKRSRQRSCVEPRQVAMALMKHLTPMTLAEIGQSLGGRDHSTVLHACRRIERRRQQDRQFALFWNQMKRTIREAAQSTGLAS